MAIERNIPVYLQDEEGAQVRVGWAAHKPEDIGDQVLPYANVKIDAFGPGRDLYEEVTLGPAQGFTFGEPVIQE